MIAFVANWYLVAWIKALAFTWFIEVGLGVFILRSYGSIARRLAFLLLGSAITHPFVWFVFPFLGLKYLTAMILAEIFAMTVEACVYYWAFRGLGLRRAFATSCVLNGASLGLGIVLRHFWGLV